MAQAELFSLLKRTPPSARSSGDLVMPIQLSEVAQSKFAANKNAILIVLEGHTGSGKSTRLNHLIHARRGRGQGPFKTSGGGKSVTTDFQVWGPVSLMQFCNNWEIGNQASEEFQLFFIDTEGTGNANQVNGNLGKALAVVSSIATIRIAMGVGRLDNDAMLRVEATLKLQCVMSRSERKVLTSAIVLMCREVGFEEPQPSTIEEMEERRRAQDDEAFFTIVTRFPDVEFTRENLRVLQQPQYADGEGAIPLGEVSYMKSMRDLARFIEVVCRTRQIPDFQTMNTLITNIAIMIDQSPGESLPDIATVLNKILLATANEFTRSIIREELPEIRASLEGMSLAEFPFDVENNVRYAEQVIGKFDERCARDSKELLTEIPDKAQDCREEIRRQFDTEWNKQRRIRQSHWTNFLGEKLVAIGNKLAAETVSKARAEVAELTDDAIIASTTPEQFVTKHIADANSQLEKEAVLLHPKCVQLAAGKFAEAKTKIAESVIHDVSADWGNKKHLASERDTARKTREIQEEAERESKRLKEEKAREIEHTRKVAKPPTFADLQSLKGPNWNPVGQSLTLYPGNKAGLRYKVLSKTELKLEVEDVKARKVRVTRILDPQDDGWTIWTITAELGTIDFKIDATLMNMVFDTEVTLEPDEAIYLDMPGTIEVANVQVVPPSGVYQQMWLRKPYQRVPIQLYVLGGRSGTYTQGPRVQSKHQA